MQKAAAFVLTVVSAGVFGFIKRSEEVTACRICRQIHELLCELRQCVELKLFSLPDFFNRAAASERFSELGFLTLPPSWDDTEDTLSESLVGACGEWPGLGLLTRDEQDELLRALSALGSDGSARESQKLVPSMRFFEEAFTRRECEILRHRGVYETVSLLVGAVIAVVLI